MKVDTIITESILEINKQLKKKEKIVLKKSFEISGPKSNLDSVIIVNLFANIEYKIKSYLGKEISLLNDDFFQRSFKKKYTIADLQNYLDKKIK